MHRWRNIWKMWSEKTGAVAILVAVCATMLLGFAAFVIDGGFGLVTRNELKNVADAAALAGTRVLGDIYCCRGMTLAQQQTYVLTTTHRDEIIAAVQDVAGKNAAGGKSIAINDDGVDIRIGQWGRFDNACNPDPSQPYRLCPTTTTPDAVEVTARRDNAANGPIATFFARMMGVKDLYVTSTSANTQSTPNTIMRPTAALTGVGYVAEGELQIPVGISHAWYTNQSGGYCGQSIQFSPTGTLAGCAGWSTFGDKSSASQLRKILEGLTPEPPTYTTPEATAYKTAFNFTGGQVTSAWDEFIALYDAKKDADGKWPVFLPVYKLSEKDCPAPYTDIKACCSNPSGPITIVGFATATITYVCSPPSRPCDPAKIPNANSGDKYVLAKVECNAVQEDARGGGGEYGTKGSIPGLVQ